MIPQARQEGCMSAESGGNPWEVPDVAEASIQKYYILSHLHLESTYLSRIFHAVTDQK